MKLYMSYVKRICPCMSSGRKGVARNFTGWVKGVYLDFPGGGGSETNFLRIYIVKIRKLPTPLTPPPADAPVRTA